MTSEEMRIAIAEALGWKRERGASYHGYEGSYLPAGWLSSKGHFSKELPDYPTDLNAMHDAEKAMTTKQHEDYCWRLRMVIIGGVVRGTTDYELVHATAAQRAEAFCRTLFSERFKS